MIVTRTSRIEIALRRQFSFAIDKRENKFIESVNIC
jgi:hypothetical protein